MIGLNEVRARSVKSEGGDRTGGVTMAAIDSINQSAEKLCSKCGDTLIAPDWSKDMGERRTFSIWSCMKCGTCFAEITVTSPAETVEDTSKKEVPASLLVA